MYLSPARIKSDTIPRSQFCTHAWLSSAREVVTFWRLAFEDHCELCDAVQRRHGIAGEAVNGLLDSGSREDQNAVGWLGTR